AIADVISRREHPERRPRRHERVPRMTVGRKRPGQRREGGIDRACVLEGAFAPLELVARRQGAVEQEVAHLFKSAVLGESLDRIASVLKLSNLTVQITYARPRSGDARQPRDIFRGVRHSFPRKSWVAPGALAIAMPSQTSVWRAARAESSHAGEGHGPLTWDLLARAAQVDKARSEVESITIYAAPLRRERLGERSRDLRHNQPHLVLEE